MADQQSTNAAISDAVKTYYSKFILKDFTAKTVWYRECPVKETIPRNISDTVQFTRYKKVNALYADNTDEFTAQQLYLSSEVVNVSLKERDGYIQLSRKLSLIGISNPLTQAADKIKNSAARSLDTLIRNGIGMAVADISTVSAVNMDNLAIDGGTLNSTGSSCRLWSADTTGDRFPMYANKTRVAQSALVQSIASTALSVKTIFDGVTTLATKNVDPLGDGYYRLIVHPRAMYQVKTSAAFKGWNAYTSNDELKKNPADDGFVGQTKIITTTLAYNYPLSGDTMYESSGSLFCSLLFGDEAYGCASLAGTGGAKGFDFFLKQSGSQTTSDPTNQKRQAAFSIFNNSKVLNKSAGLWLLSTEK